MGRTSGSPEGPVVTLGPWLPRPPPEEPWSSWRPPAGRFVLVLLLFLAGITPLFWLGRYYFRGDTQIAYLAWWYHLGERVRQGDLPLMEPLAWEAGNYVAEGQWGLFSPLTILIGVLATVVPDVVVFVTVLKIGLIVLGGIGNVPGGPQLRRARAVRPRGRTRRGALQLVGVHRLALVGQRPDRGRAAPVGLVVHPKGHGRSQPCRGPGPVLPGGLRGLRLLRDLPRGDPAGLPGRRGALPLPTGAADRSRAGRSSAGWSRWRCTCRAC